MSDLPDTRGNPLRLLESAAIAGFRRFYRALSLRCPEIRPGEKYPTTRRSHCVTMMHTASVCASFQALGCRMRLSTRALSWWDRDVDQGGRSIRPDVRLAGHDIWERACHRTRMLLADPSPAAELMESTVAQVSRYLDRIGAPLSSSKRGLLFVAFCRALHRYAAKSSRLELVGGAGDLLNHAADNAWVRQVNARLDLESIVRKLSERNAAVLMLRAAEYDWKEIARIFGVSPAAVRTSFWREIARTRRQNLIRESRGYLSLSCNLER